MLLALQTLPALAQESAPFAYDVTIAGAPNDEIAALLEDSSQLRALIEEPPLSRGALERRIDGDRERFAAVLRAAGFYAPEIESSIEGDAPPFAVTVTVTPGPLYKLSAYEIVYLGEDSDALPRDPAALGLVIGGPARSAPIAAAETALLARLAQLGRPRATVLDRRFVVDHEAQTLTGRLEVDPGPELAFGPLAIAGLDRVEESYIRRLVPWEEGARYDSRELAVLEERLRDSGLFESFAVEAGEPGAENRLPQTLRLTEAKRRSIGAGGGYASDEGPFGEAFWEHRNFFGEGERLTVTLGASALEQSLTAEGRKPNFLRLDQALVAESALTRADNEAFEEESLRIFGGLERRLSKIWRVTAGPSFEYARLTDDTGENEFALVGFPMLARRDSSDDLLSPTEGSRLDLSLTPYNDTLDPSLFFTVAEAAGSTYYALDSNRRVIAAARARIGSLAGADTAEVPANKRFYAGGGGSVRGYEFQSLGPLDAEDDPLGGRSVLELGFELRLRVAENFGVVPFVEGGQVYDDPLPTFDEEMRWAAGLGLRYFTPVGPLRFDVAFPLNGRERDDLFEFYISLGQAF